MRLARALFVGLAVHLGCGTAPTAAVGVDAHVPPPTSATAPALPSSVASVATADASASASAAPAASEAPFNVSDDRPKLPDGFVYGPDEGGGHVRCGAFDLEAIKDPKNHDIPFIRVTDAQGKKVYEAHGRRMDIEPGNVTREWMSLGWCGDLTGDGVPEVYLSESSMGAHCCYTYYLVSLTKPTKTLLMWEKGDGGMDLEPKKLKPGNVFQVTSYDNVNPPFDPEKGDPSLSYAGEPFYPIVFDLVGDAYKRKTLSFKGAIADMRRENREGCAKSGDCDDYVFLDWGMSLIVGDWDQARARVTDADLLRSLDKHAVEMRRRLEKQLGP